LVGLASALSVGSVSQASIFYVDVNSPNPTPPYSSWATAARVIQDAVDSSVAGDEVVVTNGVYATGGRTVYGIMTNRVAVDRPITLRSVNGPRFTLIQGYQLPGTTNGDGAIRCVYLTNGASLSGFTLTNGATRTAGDYLQEDSGGGVFCFSATVSNCALVGNSAASGGGGAESGTLYHCTLSGNVAGAEGGGADGSALYNCALTGNSSPNGGGAAGCLLNGCTLVGNWATNPPGGTALYYGGGASYCTLSNCIVTSNHSTAEGGGAYFSALNNCLLIGNSACYGGGASSGWLGGCTLVGNSATYGGGAFGWGGVRAEPVYLTNCIIYYNYAGDNYCDGIICAASLDHCCTTPQPAYSSLQGSGNITNEPLFIDLAAGNLRLQSNSPCVNAGDNAYVVGATDLDGRPRIVGGTVDIGAYEFQPGVSGAFINWLQQYGLSTDGSADYADSDSDGMNNWEEWICGTNPTNATSVLRVLTPTPSGINLTVSWQSVLGIGYLLERSTNLGVPNSFRTLATNLPGQVGTTPFTDTNAAGLGQLFYRVGVGN
jgi:hypothetical protein